MHKNGMGIMAATMATMLASTGTYAPMDLITTPRFKGNKYAGGPVNTTQEQARRVRQAERKAAKDRGEA